MSLSVCLLTRNEEKNLARALRSVAALADEVIVADTGSTDGTVRIAAELGAAVHTIAWQDDFAAGRNFAIQQATGDWILWLNPDEEVLPTRPELIRERLAQPEVFAYAVVVQECARADQPEAYTEVTQLRLFRRHPQVRFLGRAHPPFAPPLEEVARRCQQGIALAPLILRRHAYLSSLTQDKLRWAARLLEKELAERPGQLPYLIDYGRTLLLLNDPRGHTVLAEAAAQVLSQRQAPAAPTPEVQRLLEYLLTVSPEQSRSPIGRADARQLALHWFPCSPPLLWLLASQDFQQGNFRPAAALLERLVQLGDTGVYDRSIAFDPRILGDNPVMNLGICYTQLRELGRAEGCFQRLLSSPTARAQAAQNLEVLRRLRPLAGETPAQKPT